MLSATWLLAVSFGGYFTLLLYCDFTRPEAFGADMRARSGDLLVERVHEGSPAARAGLRVGDRLLTAAEGRLRGLFDWNAALANIEFDHGVRLEFERDGVVLRTTVVFHPVRSRWWQSPAGVSYLTLRWAQLMTLVIAIAVAVRPTGLVGQLASWFLATTGVYSLQLPYRLATIWRRAPVGVEMLFWIPLISTLVIGGALFAFFASFPRLRYPPRRVLLLCSPLVLVIAWEARFIAALVHGTEDVSAVPDLMLWIVAVNGCYVAAGVVALVRNYRLTRDADERRRIRVVVAGSCVGSTIGAAPALALWSGLDANLSGLYEPSPLLLIGAASFMAMPVSFWYAIVRHQLFDLRLLFRRGLRYAFARRAFLAAAPLIVVAMVVDGAWHQHESIGDVARHHFQWYVAALVTLAVLQFWRERCLEYLDRRLFRDRYDACSVLRAVVLQIRDAHDLRTVAPSIVAQIALALHPRWVALFVRARDDEFFHAVASTPEEVPPWPARTRLLDFVRALQQPLDIDLPDTDWVVDRLPDTERDALGDTAAHLILPVLMGSTGTEAMMVLGQKHSDEPFDREDKTLLQGIAENVSVLIEPYVAGLAATAADREAVRCEIGFDVADRLSRIAAAVSEGAAVDWEAERSSAATDRHKRMLEELRILDQIAELHRRADVADEVVPVRWGPFHLRERVGSGSFGSVFRAWDPKLDREVAVKLFRRRPNGARSWFEEGRLLARVRHVNVVTVYGADEIDGITGIWMEFVHGETLKTLVREHGVFGGHEAALVGAALGRALAAVHGADLVHQDIKAQNVMRERGGRLVLMDFGAGVVNDERKAPSAGTPIYMAPELFAGLAPSAQSDVYAVGVLLFHIASGAFPVKGCTYAEIRHQHTIGARRWLRDLRPDLPDRFVAAVERALDADPSHRFASAGELERAMAFSDL